MNFQSFFYNENFYRKLTLSIALIRLTPPDLTPRQFVVQCQKRVRQREENRSKQIESVRTEIAKLRERNASLPRVNVRRSFDLLEFHRDFLDRLVAKSNGDLNLETQLTLMDTIKRVFDLVEENLDRITDDKDFLLVKQCFTLIFRFEVFPLFQRHSIECLDVFLRQLDKLFAQPKTWKNLDLLVDHLSQSTAFYLVLVEHFLRRLAVFFDEDLPKLCGENLMKILENLLKTNDEFLRDQILRQESVRSAFETLLYASLVSTDASKLSLIVQLWNFYGRLIR